ncbi:zinc finger protein klf1 [Cladorrhinum sp. PSN332]|nr:zinc finger protein klf1 [Cladorrhinum sp. PSN332]
MASPIGYLINPPDQPPPPPPPSQALAPLRSFPNIATRLPHPHSRQHPHSHPHPHTYSHSHSALSHTPTLTPLLPAPPPPHGPAPNSISAPAPEAISPSTGVDESHQRSQSLYQCAHCLKRYSRPEHLQRHIATHTLGKRFTCDVCSKAFSRADLLKRHRTNHKDEENGVKRRRINSSPGATRVTHACQACAKARVKCEENKPCTRCKTRGVQCEVPSAEDTAHHLLHMPADAHKPDHQEDSGHGMSETSVTPDNHLVKEESQLPTPETLPLVDQNISQSFHPPYPGHDLGQQDITKLPFSDFLRDVLYEGNSARAAEVPGLAVLDFCDDVNLDFKDFDFTLLNNWNFDVTQSNMLDPGLGSADTSAGSNSNPEMDSMRSALVKIWTESPWRWVPQRTDSAYIEQSNLPLPSKDSQGARVMTDRVVKDTLHASCRDQILAIVLSTCRENSMVNRVASSFPSAEMMDSWIHVFLAAHLCQVSSWIHHGTFSLNKQSPEWLAIATAAGVALAPVATLRRFGFALQEAVRITIPSRFEENNTNIAVLGQVQALMLVQDVGLWSGNRRKMEIAECHLPVPIAMMRYRGKFGRTSYPNVVFYPSDEGKVLEDKWKRWYELESWKRLAFHAYLRDAQVSMTQFNNPSMSYAELTLPLPCSRELWFARTAEEFKIRYLESSSVGAGVQRPPSLGDLLRDTNLLSTNHHRLDVQYSISIFLHGFWALIWEFRQMRSVYRPTTHPQSFASSIDTILEARRQELCKQLHDFQRATRGWHEMSAQETMVLHLLLMNLNVCLNDLQIFSGKEGEEQAKKILPNLQRWRGTPEARTAIWHAGQIYRQGKMFFPQGHLKDFYAIAVQHASLCIWTWGIVTRSLNGGRDGTGGGGRGMEAGQRGVVYIDDEESPAAQHWRDFDQGGRPAIRGGPVKDSGGGGGGPGGTGSLLENPWACMAIAQQILQANFAGGREGLPPVSENIVLVLKQLESAAWAVGFGWKEN